LPVIRHVTHETLASSGLIGAFTFTYPMLAGEKVSAASVVGEAVAGKAVLAAAINGLRRITFLLLIRSPVDTGGGQRLSSTDPV
jgi:hypothetical protein